LSRRCDLNLNAPSLSGEGISIEVAGDRLEDVLKRLLRGYNYVLIGSDGSGKGSLIVFGPTARVAASYAPQPSISGPPTDETRVPVQQQQNSQIASASPSGQNLVGPGGRSYSARSTGQGSSEASSSTPTEARTGWTDGIQTVGQNTAAVAGQTPADFAPPSRSRLSGREAPPSPPAYSGSGSSAGSSLSPPQVPGT
jgi:hypothetical protein